VFRLQINVSEGDDISWISLCLTKSVYLNSRQSFTFLM